MVEFRQARAESVRLYGRDHVPRMYVPLSAAVQRTHLVQTPQAIHDHAHTPRARVLDDLTWLPLLRVFPGSSRGVHAVPLPHPACRMTLRHFRGKQGGYAVTTAERPHFGRILAALRT